ncbi:MAG: hypothetical protein WBB01_23395 [Phormidesmis sp.]
MPASVIRTAEALLQAYQNGQRDFANISLTSARLQQADYDPDKTHFPAGFDPQAANMNADR